VLTGAAVDIHGRRRWSTLLVKAVAAFVLVTAASLGLLMWLSPSASEAPRLAAAEVEAQGGSYPPTQPPDRFVQALVATEDHRFNSPLNLGVDLYALARVSWDRLAEQRDGGGSTIAQQLAKMLYTPDRKDLIAELEQVALAIKLSVSLSKDQILAMYAAVAYYGDGYYGLQAASCGYFGKKSGDLDWSQAALLAGVVNAPSADDPRTHPDAARVRQAHVLDRLVAVGALTRGQADAALASPLALMPAIRPKQSC
jgi:membrane peptidoglycan carboxypeptidase